MWNCVNHEGMERSTSHERTLSVRKSIINPLSIKEKKIFVKYCIVKKKKLKIKVECKNYTQGNPKPHVYRAYNEIKLKIL